MPVAHSSQNCLLKEFKGGFSKGNTPQSPLKERIGFVIAVLQLSIEPLIACKRICPNTIRFYTFLMCIFILQPYNHLVYSPLEGS